MASAIGLNLAGWIAPLAAAPPTAHWTQSPYLPWIVAGAIVALGLFVYGRVDVLRLHLGRIWAISGICQVESVRKGVLWVTPLAIIGVIVISQFQHPVDAQDAVRQTTKFCLFASALLVTVTAIILSCTNLPREIESRVIFTIVTKPTTRLEIIFGKVLGFARVSGLIILIMGAFTLAYLEYRTRPLISELREHVKTLSADSPVLATETYYINSGLLGTRSLEWSNDLQFYSRPPKPGQPRSMDGSIGQYYLLPFELKADQAELLRALGEKGAPVTMEVSLGVTQRTPTSIEIDQAEQLGLKEAPKMERNERLGPSTAPAAAAVAALTPAVLVRFVDESHHSLLGGDETRDQGILVKLQPGSDGSSLRHGSFVLPSELVERMAEAGKFTAQVVGRTPATEFTVPPGSVRFALPSVPGASLPPIEPRSDPADPMKETAPSFFSFPARKGARLTYGPPERPGPVADFAFRGSQVQSGKEGKVGLQIELSIERLSDFNIEAAHSVYSTAQLEVVNQKTGDASGWIKFSPEVSRAQPIDVDYRFFQGGDFDVLLRNTTPSQQLGLLDGPGGSIAVVSADRSFVFNLVKSLFILWMLSILVVIIAVFCSTFLSWPIAFVLTLLILLGHWGVDQLGDSLRPGSAGRSIVSTLGVNQPLPSRVLSSSVDQLSGMLRFVSIFLPDVSKFAVTEDIERGVSIPPAKVQQSLAVIFCYGLPMLVLSYVILRSKEVAP